MQAEVWQARLDPDGAKPAEDAAHRNRGVKVGIEGPDGITRSVILAATEETALLRAIFDANRQGRAVEAATRRGLRRRHRMA